MVLSGDSIERYFEYVLSQKEEIINGLRMQSVAWAEDKPTKRRSSNQKP